MDNLRLRFSKTGRAAYISHLDLMRTMQRVFTRAGLELKYSEGFNPHPQISIILPLPVGSESVCELMDFSLRSDVPLDGMAERLTACMPEGLRALEVFPAARKGAELKYLSVRGVLEYDDRSAVELLPQIRDFFARESIVITKKTKRGEGPCDIKGSVRELTFDALDGNIVIDAVISAQQPTLNPELLVSALEQLDPKLAPDFACFRRLETFDSEMRIFR